MLNLCDTYLHFSRLEIQANFELNLCESESTFYPGNLLFAFSSGERAVVSDHQVECQL